MRFTSPVSACIGLLAAFVGSASPPPSPGASHSIRKSLDAATSQRADSGAIPFILDDNRIFASIGLVKPDGSIRPALAFVDLGDPVPYLTAGLASELELGAGRPLRMAIGMLRLDPYLGTVVTTPGDMGRAGPNDKPTTAIEATLPANILKDYIVTVDYAARRLIVRRGRETPLDGVPVPCDVNPVTGLVSVNGWIGGRAYAMAIDFGSAYTWFRADTVLAWTTRHPEWRRGRGAVGESNMQSGPAEPAGTIVRIPELRVGDLRVEQVGAIGIAPPAPSFPPGVFPTRSGRVTVLRFADMARLPSGAAGSRPYRDEFDWYSAKAPNPVIGWIGGNVLKRYRLTIDYPHHRTWWAEQRGPDVHELDQVGVILQDDSVGFIISGLAERNGQATVRGIEVGDHLLRVDGVSIDSMTRGAIFDALHGTPGAVKQVTVRRRDAILTVAVPVTAF